MSAAPTSSGCPGGGGVDGTQGQFTRALQDAIEISLSEGPYRGGIERSPNDVQVTVHDPDGRAARTRRHGALTLRDRTRALDPRPELAASALCSGVLPGPVAHGRGHLRGQLVRLGEGVAYALRAQPGARLLLALPERIRFAVVARVVMSLLRQEHEPRDLGRPGGFVFLAGVRTLGPRRAATVAEPNDEHGEVTAPYALATEVVGHRIAGAEVFHAHAADPIHAQQRHRFDLVRR